MAQPVKIAFQRHVVILPLSDILPVRRVPPSVKQMHKYKRIVAVGIVEPLVVAPRQDDFGPYMLVDGHLRNAALIDLGHTTAPCLIADDDEAFTYNKRVNRARALHDRQGARTRRLGRETRPGPQHRHQGDQASTQPTRWSLS